MIYLILEFTISPICQSSGDLNLEASLFVGGADRFDLRQGIVGNCWVVR
jgi:hypothetical protein